MSYAVLLHRRLELAKHAVELLLGQVAVIVRHHEGGSGRVLVPDAVLLRVSCRRLPCRPPLTCSFWSRERASG